MAIEKPLFRVGDRLTVQRMNALVEWIEEQVAAVDVGAVRAERAAMQAEQAVRRGIALQGIPTQSEG